MSLPIYLSDPSGAGRRSAADHAYITEFMHDTVSNAVEAAGFTPVKLAAPDMVSGKPSLEGFGGVILFGGYDIDSSFYQRSNRAGQGNQVDRYELSLIFEALKAGLPVFGICRGMQLINTAFGGTLHSDIGHLTKHPHNNFGAGAYEHRAIAHDVEVFGSSVLADGQYSVASSHHQAVRELGKGLNITAFSHDGIVEMIEAPELNVIGTQWHPEAAHVQQDDTLTPLLNNFLAKVPEAHQSPALSTLPPLLSAQKLRNRFPVPTPAPSRYVSSGSRYSAPGHTPMWRDGWDEFEGESGVTVYRTEPKATRATLDILSRHLFLDEEDEGLFELADMEATDRAQFMREREDLELELAMQEERDSWM